MSSAELKAILMVAITVVLAAVVFVLVSNLSKTGGTAQPNSKLSVTTDNNNNDIRIQHVTGETIKAGDMKISIMLAGTSAPVYATCTGADFTAGSEMRAETTTKNAGAATAPATCIVNASPAISDPVQGLACAPTNNAAVTTDDECLFNGDYRVVIFHIPSSSIMLDQVVTIS